MVMDACCKREKRYEVGYAMHCIFHHYFNIHKRFDVKTF